MMLRAMPLLLGLAAAPAHADERRFMLTGFDRVRVDGPFEVTVIEGAATGAVASGERRALDSVTVRVQGTTLVVAPSVNAWGGYPGAARAVPRVTVTAGALRSAALVGGGRLTVARMRGPRVELTLTGSGTLAVADAQADRVEATLIGTGKLAVAGAAKLARFESSGAGAVDAERLSVSALSVRWQSDGDGRFAARDTAEVYATGLGAVAVAGAPSCAVAGSGPVVCGAK